MVVTRGEDGPVAGLLAHTVLARLLAHAQPLDCRRDEDLTLFAAERRVAGLADVGGDELRLSHVGRAVPASGDRRVRALHLRGRLLGGCRLIALAAEQSVQESHFSPRCPRVRKGALAPFRGPSCGRPQSKPARRRCPVPESARCAAINPLAGVVR